MNRTEFDSLCEKYLAQARRWVRVLQSHQDADDLVQLAFIRMVSRFDRGELSDEASFRVALRKCCASASSHAYRDEHVGKRDQGRRVAQAFDIASKSDELKRVELLDSIGHVAFWCDAEARRLIDALYVSDSVSEAAQKAGIGRARARRCLQEIRSNAALATV